MARLVERGLRRTVGVPGLFATAYGNVGSSIYYALGLVAAHALGLTPVVFMLAGLLFALTAKTYAEGASMYPEAGGSSSFARHAFNEAVSFFAGWALSLDYIITIAISGFFVPHYLGAFFPALKHGPGDIIVGIAVIVVLAGLNIRGLGESAKLNLVLAIVDLATQVALVVIGTFLVLDPSLLVSQVHLGTVPTWSQVIFALSVAMVAYTGIETVSNMAEEAKDPGRDVPRAVNLVLIAVLGVYAGISVVALSALPVIEHAGVYTTKLGTVYKDDPVLGIVSAFHLHGWLETAVTSYVGLLAATILFIATNAGLIGISRLSWSLAEHRQLPGLFSRLHPRYRTPWFTIVLFSTFACLLLIPGKTDFLGNLYSFGAMLSFTTAHVSIIALRIKQPDRARPYRIGWNIRYKGAQIPLPAVFGAIGTFIAWCSVLWLHTEARTVGMGWMIIGVIGYVVYRRRSGLDLTSRHVIERPPAPEGFVPLAYHSALVPIFGGDVSGGAIRRAAKLVGEDAEVLCVYVVRIPTQLPLEADMSAEEAKGLAVLEAARIAGRQSGLKVHTRLVTTRDPGEVLVQEARRSHADLVYLATTHAPPSEQGFGPITRELLEKRPCWVVVESPAASRNGGARARLAA
ncbi:MAG TPA: universal stress protein [Solirubrobacteraceae bacterium]|nr:universal stress protein [Solirubrobacteraceae bacterium]